VTALGEALALALIAAIVAITLWFRHAPAPTILGDHKPDSSSTSYHGVRPDGAADGTLTVLDDQGRPVAGVHVRHNRVSLDAVGTGSGPGYTDTDGTAHRFTTTFQRDVYISDGDLDLGTLAAYSTADTPRFQTGVRWGVRRFLYGLTALDAVVLRDAAGAGISLYPPAEYCGDQWAHIGLGVWYVAPYRGGHPGFAYGLSFSTHE
jgi:hypothetical protein